jgi:hypothetical protein
MSNLKGSNAGITDEIEMGSGGMMYLPSFMKSGIGVEGILRFCPSNLEGCNSGINFF